jgi:hypothetical protein
MHSILRNRFNGLSFIDRTNLANALDEANNNDDDKDVGDEIGGHDVPPEMSVKA